MYNTRGIGVYKIKDINKLIHILQSKAKEAKMGYVKYLKSIGLSTVVYIWKNKTTTTISYDTYNKLKNAGINIDDLLIKE